VLPTCFNSNPIDAWEQPVSMFYLQKTGFDKTPYRTEVNGFAKQNQTAEFKTNTLETKG
jgi:hypothetical protein